MEWWFMEDWWWWWFVACCVNSLVGKRGYGCILLFYITLMSKLDSNEDVGFFIWIFSLSLFVPLLYW